MWRRIHSVRLFKLSRRNEGCVLEEPGKPTDVKAVDWDKDHVDLEWKAPSSDGGAKIEKYIIEKKDRFGDWVPAAEVPGTETKGTAPNLIPGEKYQFRVKAVNKAGPGKPSDETGPITAKSRRSEFLWGLHGCNE